MPTDLEQFEAHIKSTAWYLVLSGAAKDDDEGASVFRMARMAASEAWDASRRAALEESAKACDEIAGDCWSLYKGRAPYTGDEPGRADPQVQGESDGADKCAAAIRALATQQEHT